MRMERKNMRKIQVAVILFFIVSCICYGVYSLLEWKQADHNTPVISIEEDVLLVKASASEEELLAGVTAQDAEDGDLTDRVQIASMTPLINGQERTIQYIVFDSADQLATATRKIIYEDYTSPKIYLQEPLRFTVDDFTQEIIDLAYTAEDVIDGDLTNKMHISYDLVNQTMYAEIYGTSIEPGEYTITFQVNNSAGDTCILPLTMTLVEKEDSAEKAYPVLSDYVVYTKVGRKVDVMKYPVGLNRMGRNYLFEELGNVSVKDIEIQSHVNYEEAGIYTVEYTFTMAGGEAAATTLYVVVED